LLRPKGSLSFVDPYFNFHIARPAILSWPKSKIAFKLTSGRRRYGDRGMGIERKREREGGSKRER